jgi:hypothetical protein
MALSSNCDPTKTNCRQSGSGPSCTSSGDGSAVTGWFSQTSSQCVNQINKTVTEKMQQGYLECFKTHILKAATAEKPTTKPVTVTETTNISCTVFTMDREECYDKMKKYYSQDPNIAQQQADWFMWAWPQMHTPTCGWTLLSDDPEAGGIFSGTTSPYYMHYVFNSKWMPICNLWQTGAGDYTFDVEVCWRTTPAQLFEDYIRCRQGVVSNVFDMADYTRCFCSEYECEFDREEPDTPSGGGGGGAPTGGDNGPSYSSIDTTLSSFDAPIEIVKGKQYVNGNIIWLGEVSEVETRQIVTTYDETLEQYTSEVQDVVNNYIDIGVGLCAPIEDIARIWINTTLVYDATNGIDLNKLNQQTLTVEFYNGDEAQVSAEIGGVAYRGLATVYLRNLNLTFLDQTQPEFRFEVYSKATSSSLTALAVDQSAVTDESLFIVNRMSNRFIVKTGSAVRLIDYTALTTDRDITLEDGNLNSVVVAPNGLIVAHNGSNVASYNTFDGDKLDEVTHPAFQSNNALIYNQPFLIGADFYTAPVLVASASDGTVTFSKVNPVSGDIDAEPLYLYEALLPGHVTKWLYMDSFKTSPLGVEYLSKNVVGISTTNSGGVAFTFTEFPLVYSQGTIEDDYFTYTIPASAFGGSSATLLGSLIDPQDDTLILFCSHTGGTAFNILKWDFQTGTALWNTTVPSLPNFALQEFTDVSGYQYVKYVAANNLVYQLDKTTGTVIETDYVLNTNISTTYQAQWYDSITDALIYMDVNGDLVRYYGRTVTPEAVYLDELVRDIFDRTESLRPNQYNVSSLSGILLDGWRSGNSVTAQAMLAELAEVFSVYSYEDEQISMLFKGTTTVHNVDHTGVLNTYANLYSAAGFNTTRGAMTFDDKDSDGLPWSQQYRLPFDNATEFSEYAITTNVLLDADYAAKWLELKLVSIQENDARIESLLLPPQHFAITPSDTVILSGDNHRYRVISATLGANLSIDLRLIVDDETKYTELAEIGGFEDTSYDPVFVNTFATNPHPFVVENSHFMPVEGTTGSVGIHLGIVDWFDIHTTGDEAVINLSDNPFYNVLGASRTITRTVAYGKLVTAPGPVTFDVQVDESLVIEFMTEEMAQRFSSLTTENLLLNALTNTLMVGREIIRFLDVSRTGKTVTFTGLIRALFGTDGALAEHTVGELCYYYQTDALIEYTVIGTEEATNWGVFNSDAGQSQYGVALEYFGCQALTPTDVFRIDWTVVNTDLASTLYPTAEHVMIGWRNRTRYTDSFTDRIPGDTTSAAALAPVEVYFLNAPYDETTFNSERNGTGLTYIIRRDTISAVHQPENELTEAAMYGAVFSPLQQELVSWNWAEDDLWVVLIAQPGLNLEESEPVVAYFPVTTDYSEGEAGL